MGEHVRLPGGRRRLPASDGFALVDDASNLLLAVMTGVSPEDVADEVEALKCLLLYGAIEASENFEQVRALPLDDPVHVALPPTFGGMVCLAIIEATDAEPTALRAALELGASGRSNSGLAACLRFSDYCRRLPDRPRLRDKDIE